MEAALELGLTKLRHWSETLSSREIDILVGLDIRRIEKKLLDEALKISPKADIAGLGQALHDGNQTWIGLEEKTLCTSYDEIFKMFDMKKFTHHKHEGDALCGTSAINLTTKQHLVTIVLLLLAWIPMSCATFKTYCKSAFPSLSGGVPTAINSISELSTP